MTAMQPIFSACLVVVVSLIGIRFLRYAFDPLQHIPGPFITRFTKLWYFLKTLDGDFRWQNIKLHQRFGPIVRIAPNEFSVDDPNVAKQIYSTDNKFLKSAWYDFWRHPDPHFFQDLFSLRDPQRHQRNKRTVAGLYSMTNLVQMEHCIDETVALVCLRFDEFAGNSNPFDLSHWMRCYAFDSIMYLSLNKRFGVLDDGDDKGMFSKMKQHARLSGPMGRYPSIWRTLVDLMVSLRIPSPLDTAIAFTEKQVDEFELKFVSNDTESDTELEKQSMFHQAFTLYQRNPQKMPRSALVMVGMMNVVAGSDTTGTALASAIHLLTTNQTTLKKLRQEISEKLKSAGLMSNSTLPFQDLQGLRYLQAVLKESMRLHNPVGAPMSRVVPASGASIGGQQFPGGAVIGINPWVAHRNTDVFGENANEFEPERWLCDDSERLAKMESYLLTFGQGSRSCIGKNISIIEMSKVLAQIVMRYDFDFVDEKVRHDTNGSEVKSDGGWFVVQTNLQVRVKKRR